MVCNKKGPETAWAFSYYEKAHAVSGPSSGFWCDQQPNRFVETFSPHHLIDKVWQFSTNLS